MGKVPQVAEVLILRRSRLLTEPFDYAVPEELQEVLRPGVLVRVPLARSEALGLVISLKEASSYPRLKPILEVLIGAPGLKPYQLELLLWISEYYLQSPGAVSSLFFPVGFSNALDRKISLLSRDAPPELYDFLVKTGGSASYKKIEQAWGQSKARRMVREALEKDAVRVYWSLKLPSFKPRLEYEIYLADVEAAEKLKKATRSARIRAFLSEMMVAKFMSFIEAKEEFGLRLSELKRVESSGAVRLVERIASRVKTPEIKVFDGEVELTGEQKKAAATIKRAIKDNKGQEFLLFGPTGSGKTEVYLQAVAEALKLGFQVIYLVPEISLTPQSYTRIEKRFPGQVAIFHSGLKQGERLDEWFQVEQGLKNIVVGARSALFTPVKKPGLIIIDEEHDSSYRQENSPVYDARRVARKLAEITGAVVVYGSATPSVERFYEAEKGKIKLLELTERVSGSMPEVITVDLRKEKKLLTETLKKELLETIEQGGKALLFLNRRGFSVVEVCRSCGYLAACPRCSVFLRYHRDVNKIVCHYCGYSRLPDRKCPECGSDKVELKGRGIQQLEAELDKFLENRAKIVRLDSDVSRQGKAKGNLFEFVSGKASVLIGTQMIAKGLHLPEITFAAAVNADVGLDLPDFRAEERTFQLIVQFIGRAGRGSRKGKVLIQTWQPERGIIRLAINNDYRSFYAEELELRKLNNLPPFSFLIRILVSSKEKDQAVKAAESIYGQLKDARIKNLKISPPVPAPLYKLHGRYRIQILIKCEEEPSAEFLDWLRKKTAVSAAGVRILTEVDPVFVF